MRVPLTPQQAALVEQYDRALGDAERALRLVLEVILAGAEVRDGVHYRGMQREGSRAYLVLDTPNEPPAASPEGGADVLAQ